MAGYRAGWTGPRTLARDEDFWRRVNGNFLDISVLEWCKLFAEPRGAHGWRKVLTDPPAFEAALLAHIQMSPAEFEGYCVGMRTYRDKFVAHLDDNPTAKYPHLDVAIKSTKFLFRFLQDNEDKGGFFEGLPKNPDGAYRASLSHAKEHYRLS